MAGRPTLGSLMRKTSLDALNTCMSVQLRRSVCCPTRAESPNSCQTGPGCPLFFLNPIQCHCVLVYSESHVQPCCDWQPTGALAGALAGTLAGASRRQQVLAGTSGQLACASVTQSFGVESGISATNRTQKGLGP